MLKRYVLAHGMKFRMAAAFGRLCVETLTNKLLPSFVVAAAFGRLCVETFNGMPSRSTVNMQPPSGGCVLKHRLVMEKFIGREAAAFGRLCVETGDRA